MMRPANEGPAVYLCRDAIDFRKGINGLAVLVENTLQLDPFSEQLYVFCNRRRDRIKILYFERDGLAIWYKRLEVGCFQNLAFLFNRQEPAIVAQGMDDDCCILARLHDFVQIDDRAVLHTERQRPIDPDRFLALEQIPSDQIGGGEIFVTGHRD